MSIVTRLKALMALVHQVAAQRQQRAMQEARLLAALQTQAQQAQALRHLEQLLHLSRLLLPARVQPQVDQAVARRLLGLLRLQQGASQRNSSSKTRRGRSTTKRRR